MTATTFHPAGQAVDGLTEAHRTLDPLLGPAASAVFALALLAAGLASSIMGSLAGQLVLDGFLGLRIPLLARRVATMGPAVAVLAAGVGEITALLWSQVVLCLVLPLTAGAMLRLAADRTLMGKLVLQPCAQVAGGVILAVLAAGNLLLLETLLT